jgi:hypothetical protein
LELELVICRCKGHHRMVQARQRNIVSAKTRHQSLVSVTVGG